MNVLSLRATREIAPRWAPYSRKTRRIMSTLWLSSELEAMRQAMRTLPKIPSSRNSRRGSNKCMGASPLQVTLSPFRFNKLIHSLRESGCTPTWISIDIAA